MNILYQIDRQEAIELRGGERVSPVLHGSRSKGLCSLERAAVRRNARHNIHERCTFLSARSPPASSCSPEVNGQNINYTFRAH